MTSKTGEDADGEVRAIPAAGSLSVASCRTASRHYLNAMLKSLRKFIESVGSHEPAPRFAETDHRLAAAALLVHAISVDGVASDAEKAMLSGILQRQFALSEAETAELVEEARVRDRDAVDLYGFTSVIKRVLDEEGRLRVIGMMWEMALADGAVSEFEDNLVWRVAELLGVSSRDRVSLRMRIEAGRLGAGMPATDPA